MPKWGKSCLNVVKNGVIALLVVILLFILLHPVALGADSLCQTLWQGEVNEELLTKVRSDLKIAQRAYCGTLRVKLYSPGGSVIHGLEVVREMKAAEKAGLIIEVQGVTLVASMATVVLAAGTPGHRLVDPHLITVIHAIRSANPFEPQCYEYDPNPKTENDKVLNQLILALAIALAENTGHTLDETMGWLKCGHEQIGDGYFLVKLGFADRTI